MQIERKIKAAAPAKLILSGEHSVVYGAPALAMAVDRVAETTLLWRPEHHSIVFYLKNLGYTSQVTIHKLREMKQRAQRRYEMFLRGECTICDVLQRSFELLQFTFIQLIDRLNITLPLGMEIHTNSSIPIGCGMGSSSASIVSVMSAVSAFLDLDLQMDNFLQFGLNAENLQHGRSSGLDLHLALHGGCKRFENGVATARAMPQLPMYLVNTGAPHVTTGECVCDAEKYFKESSNLLNDFTAVTNAFDKALQENSLKNIQECVRANHLLLMHINVVPEPVQRFITAVEKLGAAAKICGAGASRGCNGGMVLVVSEMDVAFLVKEFGYSMFPVVENVSGTRLCDN